MNEYEEALRRLKSNNYPKGMGSSTIGSIQKGHDFELLKEFISEHFNNSQKHDKLNKVNTDEFKHFKLHSDSTLKSLKKDDLISYIHMVYRNWQSTDESYNNVMNYAKTLLQGNQWIPVEERLPEERINPYTMDYYVYPVFFQSDNVTDIRYYSFGKGHWYHGPGIMDDYVKAWMPLHAIIKD